MNCERCDQSMRDMGFWPQYDAGYSLGILMHCWKCESCDVFVKAPADEQSARRLRLHPLAQRSSAITVLGEVQP